MHERSHRLRTSVMGLLVLLFLAQPSAAADPPDDPKPDPRAVVVAGQARFTVLTPELIRMEWSEDGPFEDRASLVFLNRRLPVPSFRTEDGDWLRLKTEKLVLSYRKGSGRFTPENLSVELSLGGKPVVWRPGMEDRGNLRGTIRTLDTIEGPTYLEPGLLSRDGWVLVDDTARPLFDGRDWPWATPRPEGQRQDWYFFGYGHDYKKALRDFTRVAGRIPMPPRFAFGSWWSRYWAYTDREFQELVEEFETHDIPLDVLVIDMDWHLPSNVRWWINRDEDVGQARGWTGYTWNKALLPDPVGFLAWCEKRGLKTPLNLHPAAGVESHEEPYPAMARAMGSDPASGQRVPFDIVDRNFAENYMKILHHPMERQGVDFWWLDWQQKHTTRIPGLTPTWWLNYVHFSDMERRGRRPLLFHRWGGLGNHRYQIGFSGDTIATWKSLAFQPHFTATASNVLYGYWSHDIGGHMPGKITPELYTRWVQFGVFSPILRTHSTKNPEAERRIWAYPPDYAKAMREAFHLRYALIPYIYTAAREAHDTGISLLRPMYYDHPEVDEAYAFQDQYMFGPDMLVAPVLEPAKTEGALVTRKLWLPEGTWIEWFTGSRLSGPAVVERRFSIEEVPVYVRAGAVIPMQPKMRHTGERPVDPLILTVFPGDAGATRIGEDEGNSPGYKAGEHAWTTVRHETLADGTRRIEILPAQGRYGGMPTERAYEIRLPGAWPPDNVTCNGRPVAFSREEGGTGWRYDGEKAQAAISLPRFKVTRKVEVRVRFPTAFEAKASLLDGVPGRLARLRAAATHLKNGWPRTWAPDALVEAAQTGRRISLDPATAAAELEKLQRSLPALIEEIGRLEAKAEPIERARAQLGVEERR